MTKTAGLPGIHLAEYPNHRHIEIERREALAQNVGDERFVKSTNEYAAFRQYANAVTSFLLERVFLRDVRDERGAHIVGSFFVHGVTASEDIEAALLTLLISKDGKESDAFTVSVHQDSYIMYYK